MSFSTEIQYYGEKFQETKEEKYFNSLYKLSYDYYLNIGYKSYHQNYHNLQDIMNSFYLNIFYFIDKYDKEKGKFHSWIGVIFTNEVFGNIYKRRKLYYVDGFYEKDSRDDDNKYDFKKEENYNKLNSIINKLQEPHKTLIIERYYNEMKGEDMAKKYGVNLQIIKNQLFGARKRMGQLKDDPDFKYKVSNRNSLGVKVNAYKGLELSSEMSTNKLGK